MNVVRRIIIHNRQRTHIKNNSTHLVVVEPQACMYVCTIACTQAIKEGGVKHASIKYLIEEQRQRGQRRKRRRRGSYAKLGIYIWICNIQSALSCVYGIKHMYVHSLRVPRLVFVYFGISFFLYLFSSRGRLAIEASNAQKKKERKKLYREIRYIHYYFRNITSFFKMSWSNYLGDHPAPCAY